MNRLAEIIAQLQNAESRAALTDAQILSLETELAALFDAVTNGTVQEVPSDDLERLNEIAGTIDDVRSLAAERISAAEAAQAAAAERQEQVEALRSRVHVVAETPPEEVGGDNGEGDENGEGGEAAPEAPAVPEAPPVEADVPPPAAPAVPAPIEAEVPVLVPAAATPAAPVPALSALAPPAAMAVRTAPRQAFVNLLTGGDLDLDAIADVMIEQRHRFGHVREGFQEDVPIARQSIDFGVDFTLSSRDGLENNTAKIEAVCLDAMNPARWRDEAIVASGGWCAPPQVDYSFPSISGSQRPVRDSLPRFGLDRGSLTYVRPTPFTDVVTGGPNTSESGLTTPAVGIWTNATDISPGSNVKGCQRVPCPTPTTVTLDAIYWCMEFGNFMSRAYPELVRQWMDNLQVMWARHAEVYLLDKIAASSTAVTTTKKLGTYRDITANIIQAAAAYRSRWRMMPNARLRYMAPSWLPAAMSADRVREQATSRDQLTVDEATIRREFDSVGVNVTFYDDSATGAGQIIGAQGPTDLRNWPSTVEQYLFHEGAFAHLDGGELDLGLVRDSHLNKTNDYRMFYETFENVAYRGFESLRIRSTVCPDGSSSLPLTMSGLCDAS